MFKNIFFIVLFIVGYSLGSPSNPLMQLEYNSNGHPAVSLTNLDVISMKKIAEFNDPLVKTERWQMKDLGYYYSYSLNVTQNEGPTENISFTEDKPLENIGNQSLNFTEININSSIPYY